MKPKLEIRAKLQTYQQASNYPCWVTDMNYELEVLNQNNTCNVTNIPHGNKAHWMQMGDTR